MTTILKMLFFRTILTLISMCDMVTFEVRFVSDTIEFNKATSAIKYLKELIGGFWNKTLTEEEFVCELTIFFSYPKNRGYIMRGNELALIMDKLGKKRLETFKEYLPKINNGRYTVL